MGINHRASTISIAIITIIFSVIALVRNIQFNEKDFKDTLDKLADQTQDQRLRDMADHLVKYLAVSSKVSIATCILSIISAAMMFGAVGQLMADNKRKKNLLLPYIVLGILGIIAGIVITGLVAKEFAGFTVAISAFLGVAIFGLLINVLFVTLISLYYRFLRNYDSVKI